MVTGTSATGALLIDCQPESPSVGGEGLVATARTTLTGGANWNDRADWNDCADYIPAIAHAHPSIFRVASRLLGV